MSIYSANKLYQNRSYNHTSLKKNPENYSENQRLTFDNDFWKNRALQAQSKCIRLEEKVTKIIDLQDKIQLILTHNQHLREQNTQLKSFISEQQQEAQHLRNQNARLINIPREVQYQQMLAQQKMNRMQYQHKIQIQKLLQQISQLHQEYYKIQQLKNQEINSLKQNYERQMLQQIQNLKRSQNGSIQLLELQLKKANENIQLKQQQFENELRRVNRQKQMLSDDLLDVRCDLKYLQNKKEQQINQIKSRSQYQINRLLKQQKLREQQLSGNNEFEIKRLKKQINDKLLEIQKLNNRIQRTSEENEVLNSELKRQRQKLNRQIDLLTMENSEKIVDTKQRVQKLAELQIQNIMKASQNKINLLQDQILKLRELLEIKQRNQEQQVSNYNLRRLNANQILVKLEAQNKQLRQTLTKNKKQQTQQLQLLKIKMAKLHQADINSIVSVYQPKVQSLSQQLSQKNILLQELRNKLHQQLQAKLHIRKQCQLQVSKLRSAIMELKVKLSAVQVQMNQNMTSLKSNLQGASKTFLLDQELKLKGIKFSEQQTRKLRQIIQAKDNQIILSEDNIKKKVQYFEGENSRLNQKILALKKQIQEKEQKRIRDLKARDEQIERIKNNNQQQVQQHRQSEEHLKNKITQVKKQTESLHDKINLLQKQKLNLEEKIRKLQHQIALQRGNLEHYRIDSQVNIQGQKDKIRQIAANTQINLKEHFQRKIKDLQADKSQLIRINTFQSEQITQLVIQYNSLQKNLKDLLDSQKRLTQFENKVINLGLDQNLIKNMSQIFRR